MATIGTITVSGYRFYNGGWSSSYDSVRASYSKVGSKCTVDKIVLPSFTTAKYSNFTINVNISILRSDGVSSGTLYGYLCTSDPASGAPTQAPHIPYIASGSVQYSGIDAGHKYFDLSISTTSLTSGGTYYIWLQTSSLTQLHYDAKVTMSLSGTVATKTLTMKAGDSGLASGAGTYSGSYGTNVSTTTTAKSGYTLDRYYGTTSDGSGNNTWTGCRGKSTYTDNWTLNANRTITAYTSPITYTNTITHWSWGFKNSEGNNGNKNAFMLTTTTFTKAYGNSIHYVASDATTIPNGFYLSDSFSSGSYTSDGSWTSYSIGTYLTQPAKATHVEYNYLPTTYTITYNLNGGTNNSANPSTYNVLYGVTFSNPTRSGYTFLRWTINGSTVTGINPGANATFSSADDMYSKLKNRTTGNVTVTAVWQQNKYKINYYTNYPNTTSQTLFGTTTHNVGNPASMINAVPARTGYVFKGWSKSKTATVPSYFSNSSTNITAATTVYAVWWPKFTWMNYDYEEWATMVQNCNKYIGTSIKVPDPRYYATEYNTVIKVIKKYYLHSVITVTAGSLIKKAHCTALATAWNAINSGYSYGDSSSM